MVVEVAAEIVERLVAAALRHEGGVGQHDALGGIEHHQTTVEPFVEHRAGTQVPGHRAD